MMKQNKEKKNLLISHVGPVHPVEQLQVNSLTAGAGKFFNVLLGSLGLLETGLPIDELLPCIPRITITAFVFNSSD